MGIKLVTREIVRSADANRGRVISCSGDISNQW
jgi:hypothetical protein